MLLRELHSISEQERLDEISRRGFLKAASAVAVGAISGIKPEKANASPNWIKFLSRGDGDVEWFYDSASLKDTKIGNENYIQAWLKGIIRSKEITILVLVHPESMQYQEWNEVGKWGRPTPIKPDDNKGEFMNAFVDVLKKRFKLK